MDLLDIKRNLALRDTPRVFCAPGSALFKYIIQERKLDMKENEYKCMLKKGEFDYIQSCLKLNGSAAAMQHKAQTNYYYDTEDYALDRAGITCRVRDDYCTLEGTLKIHGKSEQDGNLEIPIKTNGVPESFLLGGKRLLFIGTLHTDRNIYKLSEGISLMFDANTYLGERDFEMEIEFMENKRYEAGKLFREMQLLAYQYRMMCGCASVAEKNEGVPSKSARFIRKKQSMKNSAKKVDIIINFQI